MRNRRWVSEPRRAKGTSREGSNALNDRAVTACSTLNCASLAREDRARRLVDPIFSCRPPLPRTELRVRGCQHPSIPCRGKGSVGIDPQKCLCRFNLAVRVS